MKCRIIMFESDSPDSIEAAERVINDILKNASKVIAQTQSSTTFNTYITITYVDFTSRIDSEI